MKIIVSHDVDHLYPSDHFLKDLILPKMWVRSFLHLCGEKSVGALSATGFLSRFGKE